MSNTINQTWFLLTLFLVICTMNHAAYQSETTVTVRLLSYISSPCPPGVCDFSFYMCLDNFTSDVRGCRYNRSMTGVFMNQTSIEFDQFAADPVIAYVPTTEEMALLRVVVFERYYTYGIDRWNDTWWDSFNITLHKNPVSVQQRNLTLTGFQRSTRLTVSVSINCTPPFYLSEGACAKFCQDRDDQFGHYTCTTNGDRDCLPGWIDVQTNCTTPDPNLCQCTNSRTCDANGECICLEGFTGPHCSKDVDGCIPRTCDGLCGVNIGLLVGFLVLLILVIVLVVFIIRLRMSMLKKETDTPGVVNLQHNSPSAESNVAHNTFMNEHTYTNVNNNDNLQRGTNDEVLPATKTTLDAPAGKSVVPAFKANEIPGPEDSLYLEENVTYEPTVQGDTATNKKDPIALYEHPWKN